MIMEEMAYILTNFSSEATARSVSRILMQERVITSVNMFPRHLSLYPWKGELHEASETAAIFKTSVQNKDRLLGRLKDLHPYDLPSLVCFGAEANSDYVAWLKRPNGFMSSNKES